MKELIAKVEYGVFIESKKPALYAILKAFTGTQTDDTNFSAKYEAGKKNHRSSMIAKVIHQWNSGNFVAKDLPIDPDYLERCLQDS